MSHPRAPRSQIKRRQGTLGQSPPPLSRAPPGSPAPCPPGRLPGAEAAAAAAEVSARRRWVFARPAALAAARSAPAWARSSRGGFALGPIPRQRPRRPSRTGRDRRGAPPALPRAGTGRRRRRAGGGGGRAARLPPGQGMQLLVHLCTPGWRLRPRESRSFLGRGTRLVPGAGSGEASGCAGVWVGSASLAICLGLSSFKSSFLSLTRAHAPWTRR